MTAPAAMPGEADIARAFFEFATCTDTSSLLSINENSHSFARAILDLFSPILAEKDREIGQAKAAALLQGANIDVMNAAVDTAKDFVRQAKAAEARALAAEAALAAERERCARVAEEWAASAKREAELRPAHAARYETEESAAEDIAAAIRAGE